MDVSEKDAARALWKKKRQQKRQHSSFRGRERSHAVGSRVTEKVEVQQQRQYHELEEEVDETKEDYEAWLAACPVEPPIVYARQRSSLPILDHDDLPVSVLKGKDDDWMILDANALGELLDAGNMQLPELLAMDTNIRNDLALFEEEFSLDISSENAASPGRYSDTPSMNTNVGGQQPAEKSAISSDETGTPPIQVARCETTEKKNDTLNASDNIISDITLDSDLEKLLHVSEPAGQAAEDDILRDVLGDANDDALDPWLE